MNRWISLCALAAAAPACGNDGPPGLSYTDPPSSWRS